MGQDSSDFTKIWAGRVTCVNLIPDYFSKGPTSKKGWLGLPTVRIRMLCPWGPGFHWRLPFSVSSLATLSPNHGYTLLITFQSCILESWTWTVDLSRTRVHSMFWRTWIWIYTWAWTGTLWLNELTLNRLPAITLIGLLPSSPIGPIGAYT